MVFNYRNNVIVELASAVAAGVTTVNADPVKQALIPDGAQNTTAVLEEIDANGVITLREAILITNRSGGALTVVRAYQECPDSDAATTHTQVSVPFDPSNGARIGLYLTAKNMETIEADIKALQDATLGDFVTEIALIDNVDRYSTSVTGTDAYELLIDTLDQSSDPVYQGLVDGQKFDVDFDVANIGGATLTINNSVVTFGPKALTKLNGQPLASGDITAGLKTVVMYDAGDDHWRIVGTLGDYGSSIIVADLKKDFVLGEDFTSADPRQGAAFIGKGETQVESLTTNGSQTFGDIAASEKVRIHLDATVDTVSMNLSEFSFWINEVGTPIDDLEFEIFEGVLGTTPVPSDIALTQTTIDGTQQFHVTGRAWFSSNLNDKYVEIRRTGALDAVNHYSVERDTGAAVSGVTYDVYNAGVWGVASGALRFTNTFGFEKDKVYKTDPRGAEAEDMRAKAIVTGVAGETKAFFTGGIINHTAANSNLEYKEHLLVDRLLDDIQIDVQGDFSVVGTALILAGEVGANASVAQTFTMTEDHLYRFSIKLTKVGAPTDSVTAKIYDSPGGTLLTTSTTIIDGVSLPVFNALIDPPFVDFEIDNINFGAATQIYVEFERTGARDIVNAYRVLPYTGSIPFPAYAGGDAYNINSGVPAVRIDDLIFSTNQSSSYIIDTGLYDINKEDIAINTGSGFHIGNQISNGLFSLECVEEQHEKQIKQVDVQIGSVLFGFGVSEITVFHNLGVIPRTIQAVFTPPNLQTNQASVGVSNGIWVEGDQTCVYSFGNGGTGNAYESGNRPDKIGVIQRSRVTVLLELDIISVDQDKIVINGVFEGFYQLTLTR